MQQNIMYASTAIISVNFFNTHICVQVLELICTRESGAVFEAGGLNCVLSFIRDSGHLVHKDTLHSAMAVVSRLCSKMEPQDSSLETCVESLSSLLKHEDHQVTNAASSWPKARNLFLGLPTIL